jgi:hypothetical protein
MERDMSFSISSDVANNFASPSRSKADSGFSLPNMENRMKSLIQAVKPELSSTLLACAAAPGDLDLQGDKESLLGRLRALQGQNLSEVVLGSRPVVRPINFGENEDENDPLSVAMSDGKLNLEDVIREASGALRAGEGRIGINQPAKKESDIAKLHVLAAMFNISIFVHVDGHPNVLMEIPPRGERVFHEGFVGTSAGGRGCGGNNGINIFRPLGSLNEPSLHTDRPVIAGRN